MKYETPSSFGEQLRVFRKRADLTQRQLALALGVHYNTIGGWERGDTLPENKKIVLALGKWLRLDDREMRQLLEASLTAPAPYWNVPFRHNLFFTGRVHLLETLHHYLQPNQDTTLSPPAYAIHGLGGIGKTQLAIEYTYLYGLEYTAVFWVHGESIEQILASFLSIAELLDLPERREANQQRVVAAVQQWLCYHSTWLLIWDNLEEIELLRRFLPPTRQGGVLITTRRQALGDVAQNIELPVLTQEEGILLLLRRAKIQPGEMSETPGISMSIRHPDEYRAAQEIVTILGGLPLALDQAGAYIETTRCSVHDYLSLLQSSQLRLLEEYDEPGNHPLSVPRTFTLVLEQLERSNPAAVKIITACAFLAPESIPEAFFLRGAPHLGASFEALAMDPFEFQTALKALLRYSLIQRDAVTHTLSIHRLVQMVIKERMPPAIRRDWAERVTKTMACLFPSQEEISSGNWLTCEQLLSHALLCLSQYELGDKGKTVQLSLLCHVATYLLKRARYGEAEPLFIRAVHISVDNSDRLRFLVEVRQGLGMLYYEQGKYEQAKPFFKQALQIAEEALGPDHPLRASSLNNLGRLYVEQGRYEQAEPLVKQALKIAEQTLSPDHPQVASSLTNLGELYRRQGQYEQALPLFERALSLREQTLGFDHLQVASSLSNLGILYGEQEKYTQAEPLFERALRIWEQTLGFDHPYVATALNNLGEVYLHQSKFKQAEPLLKHALRIWEQTLGSNHFQIAQVLDSLGTLYSRQGQYKQAESLQLQALHILEQSPGHDHYYFTFPLISLGEIYCKQGAYEQARSAYERGLRIQELHSGPFHPKTLQVKHALHELEEHMHNAEQVTFRSNQTGEKEQISPCACGCGRVVDTSKSRGEPRRFFSNACKQRFYRNATQHKRNTAKSQL